MKIKIVTPNVPNFVRIEIDTGNESSFQSVPLTTFSDEEMDQIAKDWREALYANRERQAKSQEEQSK